MFRRRLVLLALLVSVPAAVTCSGGGSSPTEPRPGQVVVVQVRDFSFDPKSVTIQPGDTVRWVRVGADPTHTVSEIRGVFDSGAVFTTSGSTFERRFDAAGATYNYRCQAHVGCCQMQGSVRVGEGAPDPDPGY